MVWWPRRRTRFKRLSRCSANSKINAEVLTAAPETRDERSGNGTSPTLGEYLGLAPCLVRCPPPFTLYLVRRPSAHACTIAGICPACAAQRSPAVGYASLTSKYLASVMADRASYEDFEISGLRWVHSFKGWSWLACVHFTDHGHVRTYAIFIQNNAVVDGRYAVQTDACGSQTYTPFDMVTGTLGRPTTTRLPPLY
jgi:hypothetical protein